jgi:hypothetical protein
LWSHPRPSKSSNVTRHAARKTQVGIESGALRLGEGCIEHIEIGLVVDAERAAVEVALSY